MGIRFQDTFKNENGDSYLFRIYDSNFGGTATAIHIASCLITYSLDDKEDERFAPVLTSEARVRLLINDATTEGLVDDLVDAEEGRFYIALSDLVGFSWNGYILMDLVSIEDAPRSIGYMFEIRAKDGLNRLKNIDYNDAAGLAYTGTETFTGHILNCLNKIEFVSTLWPGGTNLLNIVCNWHEDSYTYASTINPMSKSRVLHKAFYHIDNRRNYIFKSCYEVLEEICRAWGCRIMLSGTAFWVVQINELDSAASVRVFSYESDGTASSAVKDLTIDHVPNGTTDLYRMSPGRFEFFRALKHVRVDYEHIATRNLSEIAGQVWTEASQPSITIENVDQNAGNAVFRFAGKLQVTSDYLQTFDYGKPYHLIFFFTFRIGTYYLRRDLTFDGSTYSFGTTFWDSPGPYYYYYLLPRPIRRDPESVSYSIEIVTPGISTDNDLIFTFNYSTARWVTDGTEINAFDMDVDFVLSDVYLEYLYAGTFDEQNDILRYQSTNGGVASAVVELKNVIGDGPNSVSPGHIEVENDAATWVLSDAWRVGNSGTYKAFSQLLCNEIIKGQLTPVRKFANVPFQMVAPTSAALLPHKAIVYDSARWAFQGGVWDVYTRIWTGTWWKLQSASTYTEETALELLNNSQEVPTTGGSGSGAGSGSGSGSGSGGGTGGNIVRQYSESFTADGLSDTFTVTKNGGVLQGDENQLLIFRNGQYISSTYISSIDAPNGQVQLTFTPPSGDEITIVWIVIE